MKDSMHDLANRLTVLAAAVVAVLAVGAVTIALTVDRTPTPAPARLSQNDDRSGTPRRLVYAEGESVHFGDQTIDAGADVVFVEATDDGVVFITMADFDHRGSGPTPASLWFTDGSDPERIGVVDMHHVYDFAVATANPGSLVAWLSVEPGVDTTQLHNEEISVYDSHQRKVVARVPVPRHLGETIEPERIVVNGDRIYWENGPGENWPSVGRYDISTKTQKTVSWSSYRADLANNPRMLSFGNASDQGGPPPVVAQRLAAFMQNGDRLVPTDNIHYGSRESEIPTTRLDGQPLQLRVPAGYDAETTSFVVVQWLNDRRLVLFAYHEHNELPMHVGDLLVCPVPTGSCEIHMPASDSTPYFPPGDVY
jgi:hypothetical protein